MVIEISAMRECRRKFAWLASCELFGEQSNRHRLIAYPLQVRVDFYRCENEAQVHGHGLLHRHVSSAI